MTLFFSGNNNDNNNLLSTKASKDKTLCVDTGIQWPSPLSHWSLKGPLDWLGNRG